jgi:hypothetical protein
MLRLASDADVRNGILRGLRRRAPEIDLLRVQDALPDGTADPLILAWAAAENRVLITNDRETMIGFAYERLARATLPECLRQPLIIPRAGGKESITPIAAGATHHALTASTFFPGQAKRDRPERTLFTDRTLTSSATQGAPSTQGPVNNPH